MAEITVRRIGEFQKVVVRLLKDKSEGMQAKDLLETLAGSLFG